MNISKKLTLIAAIAALFACPARAQEGDSFKFMVGSLNILAKKFYDRYYKHGKGDQKAEKERHKEAIQLFEELERGLQEVKEPIFIALQELEKQMRDNIFENVGDVQIRRSPEEVGLGMAYFGSKTYFTINGTPEMHKFVTPGASAEGKGFLVLRVDPLDDNGTIIPNNTIAVINTHLQGGPGGNLGYAGIRYSQVDEIIDYIKANQHANRHWILCGDFNTDSRQTGRASSGNAIYEEIHRRLQAVGLRDVFSTWAPDRRVSVISAGNVQNLDYMFASTSLEVLGARSWLAPKDTDAHALTHGEPIAGYPLEDAERQWLSDHVMLIARFSFKIPTAPAIAIRPGVTPHQVAQAHVAATILAQRRKAAAAVVAPAAPVVTPIATLRPARPAPAARPVARVAPAPATMVRPAPAPVVAPVTLRPAPAPAAPVRPVPAQPTPAAKKAKAGKPAKKVKAKPAPRKAKPAKKKAAPKRKTVKAKKPTKKAAPKKKAPSKKKAAPKKRKK